MSELIKKAPLPLSGLMLGYASSGLFLGYLPVLSALLMGMAGAVMLLLLVKLLMYPVAVFSDLKDPAIASSAGAFPMGLLFLAVALKQADPTAGLFLWWLAICVYIALITYFTATFVVNLRLESVHASWFLIYVGPVAIAATCPAFGMQALGSIVTVYGFFAAAVLLILICWRYLKLPAPAPVRPLTAIFAAPFGLCLIGYARSFSGGDIRALLTLWAIASFFYMAGLLQVLRTIGDGFYPSFSAYTFPFINAAIGSAVVIDTLRSYGLGGLPLSLLTAFGLAQSLVAALLTGIVTIKYVIFITEAKKEDVGAYSHSSQSHRV